MIGWSHIGFHLWWVDLLFSSSSVVSSSSSSSSSESLVSWRILCRTNSLIGPLPNGDFLTPALAAHVLREANRMGDGVETVGDTEVERVNDSEGGGDNTDNGDNDKDESDGVDELEDESDDKAGDNGRGRTRRVLSVEDAAYGRATGGTAGKARGVVSFFFDEAPGNVLLISTLAT